MTKWTYQWDYEKGVYQILDNGVYHSESPYEICASQIVRCLNEAQKAEKRFASSVKELHHVCTLLRRSSEIFDRIKNCPHKPCLTCKGIFEAGGRGAKLQTEITAALEGKPGRDAEALLKEAEGVLEPFAELAKREEAEKLIGHQRSQIAEWSKESGKLLARLKTTEAERDAAIKKNGSLSYE